MEINKIDLLFEKLVKEFKEQKFTIDEVEQFYCKLIATLDTRYFEVKKQQLF